MDLIVCTESPKRAGSQRVNGSMARRTKSRYARPRGAATSTLTECAFSWKFAGRRKDVLLGPLQESHPSLDCPVGVLEGAMLGQLLTEHLRQLPVPLVPVECASVYQDHYVLREVAAEVLLQAALEAHVAAPVFGQVQAVVEHFLGRAATEVLHNAILYHIVEHADHQDDGTRTSTVHPKKGFHPSAWKGKFSEVRAGLRVVASCSSVAKVDSRCRCSERREVSEEDEQGHRSTVDRNVQQPLHAADRSGRPGSRLHRPCPGAPRPP